MKPARVLFAAVLALAAAACSAGSSTPTFPDAPASAAMVNQGALGSGYAVQGPSQGAYETP